MTADANTLYRQTMGGNPAAQEELFEVLSVSFRLFVRHRVVNVHDAEEIVQDALTTVAEKYRSVQFQSSFAGWAHKVLRNKLLDHYKAKRVRSASMSPIELMDSESAGLVVDQTLKSRLLECLRKLHGTNSFHARALNLHYQGFTTAEICGKLGVTSNNLYVMLSRARTLLKTCLERGEIGQ